MKIVQNTIYVLDKKICYLGVCGVSENLLRYPQFRTVRRNSEEKKKKKEYHITKTESRNLRDTHNTDTQPTSDEMFLHDTCKAFERPAAPFICQTRFAISKQVKITQRRCFGGRIGLTDGYVTAQPTTCVHHKDLSCPTTASPL